MPDQQKLTTRYILQWFSPRWFIFVMGTGALANVYQLLSGAKTGALHTLAEVFLSLAMAVFVISAVFLVVRFFVGLDCILKEWRHASLIQFYSTISIAAAVCATGLLNIPLSYLARSTADKLAAGFWWISLIEGVFFLFFMPFKVSTGHHAEPRRALGFWFLSPVGIFVLVFAGNFWATHMQNPAAVNSILLLNTILLGIAIPLTIIFYTIILFRALFHNFPRRDVAPSFMIGVAPVGVSIIAMNTIVPVFAKSGLDFIDPALLGSIVKLVSILLWGFGIWWLIYALTVITLYFLKHKVPVTLGYWAFIFPPVAYTIATLMLANSLDIVFLKVCALVLTAVFSTWWVVNVILTIRGMLNKSIFDVAPTFKGDIPYL
ncbi:MAG: hypothetical protein ACOCZS_04730, partial [Verrucomicrobiota bacterium]